MPRLTSRTPVSHANLARQTRLSCDTTHSLQHLMPEFEALACDVVAVSADTRGKACSFVSSALLASATCI